MKATFLRARPCARVVLVLGTLLTTVVGCKCQKDELVRDDGVKTMQRAHDVDRVRFNLKTPDDYAKEAYIAIDVDNVHSEFRALRQTIEAELAAPAGSESANVSTGISEH